MPIYVITHKNIELTLPDDYYTIQGGAAYNHCVADFYDDEGDNISLKNREYCELTAMYWIWKNRSTDDYVGICHYRRFFSVSWSNNKFITSKIIQGLLSKYDIILPQKAFLQASVEQQFIQESGKYEDLQLVHDIIREKFPEYVKDYELYLQGNRTCYKNMMVCRKELYDQYCSWLFTILFEFGKRCDLSNRSNYEKRIFGFLAERLLNVWVIHNHLRICHLFIIETEKKQTFLSDVLHRFARVYSYQRAIINK